MDFQMIHPADQLVLIMQRIYEYGLTTTSGGNLSILDENGDIWITPSGIDKGALRNADMIQVKPDGQIIGIHKPSVELPFHSKIYKMRPDIKAVLHAHPPNLVAFSLARVIPETHLLPNVPRLCGEISMAAYAVPGSDLLGEYNAREFEKGHNVVMMENHGCVIGADDLFSAFRIFETLDTSAQLQIDAVKIGKPRVLSDEEIKMREQSHPVLDEFIHKTVSSQERAIRRDMCRYIHRSYEQRLFTSTQGTFSHRLDENSFVITPYNKDRKLMEPGDMVTIKKGMCEMGKRPSRSVLLHEAIYKAHPEINCILIALPPAIMAFAVTDAEFDSRTIPESYINLRDVKKVPFLYGTTNIADTVKLLGKKTPVLIMENECVLVTGHSLHAAFDRLEVLEYSAKALISVRDIGPLVPISQEEIAEIDKAFKLN
ncbi:MAG: class II aldolase/adducin family protein [Bacillota bacterium]|nr:class II aldolase/adducin family protein [Bacillota bacterium]